MTQAGAGPQGLNGCRVLALSNPILLVQLPPTGPQQGPELTRDSSQRHWHFVLRGLRADKTSGGLQALDVHQLQ